MTNGEPIPKNLPGIGSASAQTSQEPAKQQEKHKQEAKAEKGSAGEYVIKGEAKLTVESEKPPLNIPVDENQALSDTLETEKELFTRNPPEISEIVEAAPLRHNSSYVIVPRFLEFRGDSVAHEFRLAQELARVYKETNPKRAEERAHWEFKVADANGRVFFKSSGKGMPPETLTVQTVNDKGETIRVGSPYSGVLMYWDSHGNPHTVICESFKLSGLVQKNPKGHTIYLAISSVFEKIDSTQFTHSGRQLLQETADWIKMRRSAQAPLSIQVQSRNDKIAQAQAEALARHLTRLLKRPKTSLTGQGKSAPSGLDTHIAITVFAAQ